MPHARVAIALVLLAASGCGRADAPELPAACREGEAAVHAALRAAPGEVRLAGGEPLSGCLIREAEQGDVLLVGEVYLAAAAALGDEARADPRSDAAVRLGYLLGAAERGAGRAQGIWDELVRRLAQEAAGAEGPALARGRRAGAASG